MKSEATKSETLGAWEAAYRRFETPDQEIRKFMRRLQRLGAGKWSREARIAELFCGRGNGLHTLQRLGFSHLEGVDLSPALVADYTGSCRVLVGDCRQLPFGDASKDVIIVQGGLHHLESLKDLEKVLDEVDRVLSPGGLFVAVEPWLTPFLRFVHALCGNTLVRRISKKMDALAVMIELERDTYERWLMAPDRIRSLLQQKFAVNHLEMSWGKVSFVGRKHPARGSA